jgi:hypothetical protein
MQDALRRFQSRLAAPLSPASRWLLALAVIPLAASFALPLWNIRMKAPQYPDGLELDIYAYTIEGGNQGRDLAEINTLNHYIGMRKIDRGELSDLDWIPFAMGALALLTLRAVVMGDGRAILDLAALTVYFSLFSAARFAFKLYSYGHNLDPTAPIRMEPFSPAILGSKDVANFTTWSYPRGATFLIGAFASTVVLLTLWHLLRRSRPLASPP